MNLWLARMQLDRRDPAVRKDLKNVGALHQRVMSLFPDSLGTNPRQQGGVLFRIDETHDEPSALLVQSQIEPNPEKLPPGYRAFDTRKLGPLLDALSAGQVIAYRIAGNAVKRVAHDNDEYRAGQIVPLNGAAADEWWARRAKRAGLTLTSTRSHPLPILRGTTSTNARVCHAVTRFDGTAVVRDPGLLRLAIVEGVGKGKAYGCGLLSIALLHTTS